MKENKELKINGTMLEKRQLDMHLEKIAAAHIIIPKSEKSTYPIPILLQNYEFIKEVYNLLNDHLKSEINIYPAGEWLLDNFYIIDETVKQIVKELTLKKYTNFVGLQNREYEGFSRIYVLAAEIVAYTDGKIEKENLEEYLKSYQAKKTLSMDEIWNIGIFLQISIIQKIKEVCEKILSSQLQKYKAQNIVERIVEGKNKEKIKTKNQISAKNKKEIIKDARYPFIEYMAYLLKKEGKKGIAYLNILEETVEKLGTTISDVIQKEHFDIAVQKVLMGNLITSIKSLQRINFLEIFEKINGVEDILKQDPAKVYPKMDYTTKEYYRNKIKEISKKTKISEIYIARKLLEITKEKEQELEKNKISEENNNTDSNQEKNNIDIKESQIKENYITENENNTINKENLKKQKIKEKPKTIEELKKIHIGYYLIDEGIDELFKKLEYAKKPQKTQNQKVKIYITAITLISILISISLALLINIKVQNIAIFILSFIIFFIPSTELVIQTIQYILSKIVKPKLIPKLDLGEKIEKEYETMVIIPTIINSKEKVKELAKALEVYYYANKSPNLYFTILGDCTESNKKEEEKDKEIIEEGKKQIEKLNKKYKEEENDAPIFNFIYRKRTYNEKEGKYLGWERKRGMICQFNEYLLGNIEDPFRVNTIEETMQKENKLSAKDLYKIKYIITLDQDTELTLNTASKLIGAMSHILNKPIIDNKKNIVTKGHALIQPRIGVNLQIANKNLFTKIFAGAGGTDNYTNAISDTYQDNFSEGIFTGKGIYDLKTFSKVLTYEIPENTVLSHDLLEGNYLRCGLASDIMLMDGYPNKYNSFITRLSRWIRGDWQITKWLKNKKLNLLSKYKILDNLRRSLFEISIIISLIYIAIISVIYKTKEYGIIFSIFLISIIPYLLELINMLIFKKEGEEKQKTFTPKITGLKGAIIRIVLTFANLPTKAYISLKAIVKTIYRKHISKKHLLEWTTSEEAEKSAKEDLFTYAKLMIANLILGTITLLFGLYYKKLIPLIIGILWIIIPKIMQTISKTKKVKPKLEEINKQEQEYVRQIAKETWDFFKEYLTEENNYLIPDNFQENRTPKIVLRTSSTNIGLSYLAVISAYDMKFITPEKTIEYIKNITETIESLPKWNGHLYNWYNIKTKQSLYPRYVSTVDSGNFVGYLYVTKAFLEEQIEKLNEENLKEILIEEIESLKNQISNLIKNTDFSLLYSKKHQIFSIGYNIEENKLTDSYYDLLASEARQASIVAIAKKDVPAKHWNLLSRTLTILGKYKGLISWSGTAFEYLMPNINIPKYEGSLLDESCKFMIMNQIEYAKNLKMPWGISEAAFNLKDLQGNYQYKAFGLPWLGLKRGLGDEIVVSSYGSILAIQDYPKKVVENIKHLEKYNMRGKYGFYESLDFTPERVEKNQKAMQVKTYMAHHQALILLSINNLFNDNTFQKRFMKNPELEAINILLQETMPEKAIITKENKEKIEKPKCKDYEDYIRQTITKIDDKITRGNIISNENYSLAINQKGEGVSKYKNIYINRFKITDDYSQGIFFGIKNIKTKKIWSTIYNKENENQYKITFSPDKIEQEMTIENIETKQNIIIAPEEAVEIRKLTLKNLGQNEEILEVTSYFEPVLSRKEQDYAHPVFNNLFLVYDYDEETKNLIVKRKKREENDQEIYLITNLWADAETIGDLEFEIDKEKFLGRGNLKTPQMIVNSSPLSKKIGLALEGIVALKKTIKLKPQEKIDLNLIISVSEEKKIAEENLKKYKVQENIEKAFELSKAQIEANSRFLNIKGKDIKEYQRLLSYIIFQNPAKKLNLENISKRDYAQSELWKYGISGDLPIILVKIKDINDSHVVKEVLKLYEFARTKHIELELVILDEEKYSYESYVKEEIENAIISMHMSYLNNIKGGIFRLNKNEMDKRDRELLDLASHIIIDAQKGGIKNSLDEIEEEYLENIVEVGKDKIKNEIYEDKTENIDILENPEKLKYFNEYGAFSEDGKEYLIRLAKNKKLPTVWSHIMANQNFGTVVTENMGGYTWYKNCRLNRITSWENKPLQDIPSEIIYIKDKTNNLKWSIGQNPMPDEKIYNVIYGFGYTKYIHRSDGLLQELQVFVPKEDSIKIQILKLKNETPERKNLKIIYYAKPVLGEDEIKSNGYINLKYDENNNIIIARNLYNSEFKDTICYVSNSEKIKSYTGDKEFFKGLGGLENPDALDKISLNNENSIGKKPCIAYEIEVEIESFASKEIVFMLGAEESIIESKNKAYKYSKIQNCMQELDKVKQYWKNTLERLQVYTPIESINIILNGWAIYQTIVSRLLARSGYYQSGGAYGFRDQLQDTLALKYINPEILKKQIIKHSKHQFIEGDVEHWWHDETNRGIRTRFSDDLLWLVYLVIKYIEFTGDNGLLEIETPYLSGEILKENEEERYDKFLESKKTGTIYEHCIKAINKSLNFGKKGLPKIGTGDWNDGFNKVGNKGEGESIWLGFFMYNILDKFIPICKERLEKLKNEKIIEIEENELQRNMQTNMINEEENKQTKIEEEIKNEEKMIQKLEEIKTKLKKNLNTNGWDGRWYKRAYTDSGDALGSMENDECRIDSIAQSWSIISNAGENDKKYISLESLENHLVDRENGIIKLLDPPFKKGKIDPGYIKAYMPGVRENGGQYTHASCWAIIAEAMLGFGNKAVEFYKMINPIEHSRTKEAAQKYKVEPYAIAADIYGANNLAGRGGWTWYTGSSSWYYTAGIEYILGLKIENGIMEIIPCITNQWQEYQIRYKYGNSIYNITVKNPDKKNTGVTKVTINGKEIENKIKLEENGGVFNIEVIL